MKDSLLLSDPKAIGIRCEGLRMRSRHTSRSVAPIGIFHRKSALHSMCLQEGTVRICNGCPLCRTVRILRVDSLSLDMTRILLPLAAVRRAIRTLEVERSDGIIRCQTLEPLGVDEILLCRTLDGNAVSSA